ncbi:MAG: hypothetical protein M1167_00075 [Chloroflexi bacterium]|nr:hypothetical protein [Chloroflexota bacterium]MCL5949330.1 hypothetical protein [Candidatus Bathyarchaeota archaeon]
MSKKAIIIFELVEESAQTSNRQIEKEILAETQIPWCAKINKVEIYNS